MVLISAQHLAQVVACSPAHVGMHTRQVGARSIVLPAARETIETWVHGFGFGFMDFDQESTTRRELRVLVFPGTRLLYRKTAAVSCSPVKYHFVPAACLLQ